MITQAVKRLPEAQDDFWGEPIYVYTRQQATEDGVLIDVSQVAREAGFRWPVAMTAAVHHLIEDIPPKKQGIEDYAGRLWDVLWMAFCAIKRGADGREILFDLILHHPIEQEYPRYNKKTGVVTWHTRQAVGNRVTLKMVSGPIGPHDPAPCLTIMLPDED